MCERVKSTRFFNGIPRWMNILDRGIISIYQSLYLLSNSLK